MLRLMFCFSCCQSSDTAYKRSIRTAVNKRNEKLTEVANFDDIIRDVNEDLKKQKILSESQRSLTGKKSKDDLEASVSTANKEQFGSSGFLDNNKRSKSDNDLTFGIITDSINVDDDLDRINKYARLDYSPVPDVDSINGDKIEASLAYVIDNANRNKGDDERPSNILSSNIDETKPGADMLQPSYQTGETIEDSQKIAKPPRPSTETIQQQLTSSAALSSPLSESTSSLMSFNSGSVPSNMGGGSSRMSWDTTTRESLEESFEDKDGVNYDHEFICSRLDEIFNQQISLLNIDSTQLVYENIAIIIAYDKMDAKNNNRLICFATSKAESIKSDDLNSTSLIDMRAATLARRALLLYLYKEIEIINANSKVSGKVLSHDAYLLEQAYKGRQPVGYKIKNNIGLSMYINRIEATSQIQLSRPSSRASTGTSLGQREGDNLSGSMSRTEPPKDDTNTTSSSILRLKSIDHKISLWNVLGLQGSLLGMMVEPIYLDHVILGQVDDLKRLKTFQSKSAKSSLSVHANSNKPYRLASPKLILWRDDCQAVYKSIKLNAQTSKDDNDGDDTNEHCNSLNWTYHDYLDDHAAELIEVKTGAVKSPYLIKTSDDDKNNPESIQVGSRLCKTKMMQRLMKIMTNASSSSFLNDGHNGATFFEKTEPGTRVTYRALKNLAYQYNYVKYLCSPIFMNDLREAAGGIDWVNSYDKVKNFEDQINCKMPYSSLALDENTQLSKQTTSDDTNTEKPLITASDVDVMNDESLVKLAQSQDDELQSTKNEQMQQQQQQQEPSNVPNPVDKPLRSSDNKLANLSTPSSLTMSQSSPSTPTPSMTTSAPTPTPSEVSSTKSKSKAKALLKKWRIGKKKKKDSVGQMEESTEIDLSTKKDTKKKK